MDKTQINASARCVVTGFDDWKVDEVFNQLAEVRNDSSDSTLFIKDAFQWKPRIELALGRIRAARKNRSKHQILFATCERGRYIALRYKSIP